MVSLYYKNNTGTDILFLTHSGFLLRRDMQRRTSQGSLAVDPRQQCRRRLRLLLSVENLFRPVRDRLDRLHTLLDHGWERPSGLDDLAEVH